MKKILAMMLTAAMMLSMGTAVWADGEADTTTPTYEHMTTVTVSKTYKETNEGTTSPAETFTFSALTCTSVTDAAEGVTPKNAPVPTIASVEYAAGEAGSENATKDITITLPEYTSVGVYTYTFTENDGNTAGVTYRKAAIELVVTVIEQDGKIYVAAVHTEGEGEAKSDDFDNEYSAGSLEVSKTVTGILGDKQKDFTVKVTFTAPEGDTVREAITYVDGTETKTIAGGWNTTAEATITLKDGETVTFTNIPYGVTYTVEEDDYTGEGYDEALYAESDSAMKIDSAKDTVGITNNKGGTVDTGISVDSIPYIAMLGVVAVGGAGFMVSKKRRSED